MPTPNDEPTAPHCITCGAVGRPSPSGWITAHESGCTWMAYDLDLGHDVIWQQTLDDGAFTMRVMRIDEGTGLLQVFVTEGERKLHEEQVPLAYGARFGPDMDDVAEWQEITIAHVDRFLLKE